MEKSEWIEKKDGSGTRELCAYSETVEKDEMRKE